MVEFYAHWPKVNAMSCFFWCVTSLLKGDTMPPGADHIFMGMLTVLLLKRQHCVLPWHHCQLPCWSAPCHGLLSVFWRVGMLAGRSTWTAVSDVSTIHACLKEPVLTISLPYCLKDQSWLSYLQDIQSQHLTLFFHSAGRFNTHVRNISKNAWA